MPPAVFRYECKKYYIIYRGACQGLCGGYCKLSVNIGAFYKPTVFKVTQLRCPTACAAYHTVYAESVDYRLIIMYNVNSNLIHNRWILFIIQEAIFLNKETEHRISSGCEDFVCKVCRTKNGYEHQKWCSCIKSEAGCSDCYYLSSSGEKCIHPIRRKAVRKK